jgi:uncharacterized protein (DUF433 family)
MSRYPLKLPMLLKHDAELWARRQGVSLNQFIVWAVAEKIGALKQQLDDPRFAQVAYRVGASGWPVPVIRGTGIRAQTVAIAAHHWHMPAEEIAAEYELTASQVAEVLGFYQAHRREMDLVIAAEEELEPAVV